jgi:hypothetical protein
MSKIASILAQYFRFNRYICIRSKFPSHLLSVNLSYETTIMHKVEVLGFNFKFTVYLLIVEIDDIITVITTYSLVWLK